MNRLPDDEVLALLRAAMPVEPSAPPSDLWPRVRRKIDEGTTSRTSASDWLLAAALVLLCLLHSSLAGILLLHF